MHPSFPESPSAARPSDQEVRHVTKVGTNDGQQIRRLTITDTPFV